MRHEVETLTELLAARRSWWRRIRAIIQNLLTFDVIRSISTLGPGPTMALHILVVDYDADVLAVLVDMLRVSGFIVTAADSDIVMREILADKALLPLDAVVLDSALPGEPSATTSRSRQKLTPFRSR